MKELEVLGNHGHVSLPSCASTSPTHPAETLDGLGVALMCLYSSYSYRAPTWLSVQREYTRS